MLKKLWVFIPLLALASGCKNKIKTTFNKFPKTISLTGSVLNLDKPLFSPQGIILKSGKIVVLDRWKENNPLTWKETNLHVFDLEKRHFLGSGGLLGSAAGEVLAPWTITASHDNSIWLYDVGLARLTNFNMDSLLQNKSYRPTRHTDFSKDLKLCYYPLALNDTSFVSPHYTGNGRLAFINNKGSLLKYSGTFPTGKSEKISHQIHAQAYQSVMCTNPERTKIALATRYSDQIEIYDAAGKEVNKIVGNEGFKPKYRALKVFDNVIMELAQKGKFGYIFIQGTDRFIYALYSGMSRAEFPGRANYGQSIRVFDWQGTPVAEYKLDHLIFAFDFDENTGNLLAVQQYPEARVIKYQLPLAP